MKQFNWMFRILLKREGRNMTTVALFYDNVRTINQYTGWHMHSDVIDLAMRITIKNRAFDPNVYEGVKEQIKRHTHLLSKARYDKGIRHAMFARAHCEKSIDEFVYDVFQNVRKLRDMGLQHKSPLYQAAIYFEREQNVSQPRVEYLLQVLNNMTPTKLQKPSAYQAVVLAKLPEPLNDIKYGVKKAYDYVCQQGFDKQYAHVTAAMSYIRKADVAICATTTSTLKAQIEKETTLRPVYDSYLWLISTKHDAWTAMNELRDIRQRLQRLPTAFPAKTDMTLLALQLFSAMVLDSCATLYEDDLFQEMMYDFTTTCDNSGKSDTACEDASSSDGGSDSSDGGGGD